VTIADACIEYGLEVAELSEATKVKLKKIVPPVGTSIDNPLDLGMMSAFDLELIVETVGTLARDEHVDMIIKTVGTNQPDYIRREVEAMVGIGKPVVYNTGIAMRVVMEEPKPVKGVAIYPNGRRAAQVLSKMVRYQRYCSAK
jgi:acyl-CoA synthetase (NDP forming)